MPAAEPKQAQPPPLPPAPAGRGLVSPRLFAVASALLAGGAALWLSRSDPEQNRALFLPCIWHEATGTHCPGCGITRALHDLLHGRVLAALDHNALGLLVLCASAAALVIPLWRALRHDTWEPPALPRHTARWLMIGGVAWAVARNLPWRPFTLLAP